MSFSFVVEGNPTDKNMGSEEEMGAVREAIADMFSAASASGLYMRVGSFNPPDWVPDPQNNEEGLKDVSLSAAQGSVGDTGEGAMGDPETPVGPDGGEQTQRSA